MHARPKHKEKLSIYLAKLPLRADEQLIKIENAKRPVLLSMSSTSATATLYVKQDSISKVPEWSKFLTSDQNIPDGLFGKGSTVGAVVVVRLLENIFLLTFGTGHHLLRTETIERDFGLRVTLNSVDSDKLRSLDKSSYDSNPLNSRTQSTKDADVYELHMDSEMDMLYAVTGLSIVPIFGDTVTGRDALTITPELQFDELPALLAETLRRYSSKLPSQFEWVDNINKIKDQETIEILEMELDDCFSDTSTMINVWIGEPEVVDWENQIGYSFDMYGRTPRHTVLRLDDLTTHLNLHGLKLTVNVLKEQTVHINNSDYQSIKSWPAYRCIYAEIVVGKDQYILRNGIWYSVNRDFVSKIDLYLSDLKEYELALPIYSHDSEEQYNAHAAESDSSIELMDKKNTQIGGPYDKIEFCDLIRNRKDLIHIKYYRSSSTLSHLFAQGCVASEAFVGDFDFRNRLNKKLPASMVLADPVERPNPRNYRIVYAIATEKALPQGLPFFSKVTLKNSLKTLRALDFQVAIARISIHPDIYLKKKIKPH